MAVTWDEEQTTSKKGVVWDEKEEDDALDKFGKGALGLGAGLTDLASGLLKFPAGIALGVGGAMSGERADIARDAGHAAMEETFPGMASRFPELHDNTGYKAVMWPFEKLSEGIDWIGNKASDDPHIQGSIKQSLDIGTFAAPALGRKVGQGLRMPTNRLLGPSELGEAPKGKINVSAEVLDTKIEPKGKVIHLDENGMPIEPKLGDTSKVTWDEGPRIGETRTPEEIAAEKATTESGLAGIEQKELFDYESPYLGKDRQLVVDENGIPFDPERTADVGKEVAGSQGDLFTERTPYEGPEAGRPKTTEDISWEGKKTKYKAMNEEQRQAAGRGPLEFQGERIEPTGIDYWSSILEDLNLPTEKAIKNRTLQSLINRAEEQRNYIETQLQEKKSVPEVQKSIAEYETMQERIHEKLDEIYGRVGAFDKAAGPDRPLTAKNRGSGQIEKGGTQYELGQSWRKLSNHPFGKKQGGRINLKEIKEGVEYLKGRFTRALEAAKDVPQGLKGRNEGVSDIFKRGYDEFVKSGEPNVFRNKQRGAINPEVFKEGFRKAKEIAEKGVHLIAKGGPEGLRVEVIDDKGVRLGGAFFDKKTVLPETFTGKEPLTEHQSLFSRGTGITESAQGQGLATDIYKFVAELGNDIVPSFSRSPEGRKMWEGFEKKGISNKGQINRQRGAIDLFGKDKPTSKAADKIREHLVDTRSPKEFVSEEIANIDTWKDIDRYWTEVLPASSIAAIARKSPAIRWIEARVSRHDREARISKENAKYGSMLAPKRGEKTGKNLRSDDGAITQLERLSKEDAEKTVQVWLEHFDGQRDLSLPALKEYGLTDKQAQAALAASNQFKIFADKYNELATQSGGDIKPIKLRPGYFAHLWDGDYRVRVKDHKGALVDVYGAKNKHEADIITKELQEKFPEFQIDPIETGSRYDLNDTSAFREAIGILDKEDPARKYLQKAYNDIMEHRGFRKQTLFRGGVGGFLGSEGPKDAIKAMEMYFDRGYNFLANQKKRQDFGQFLREMAEKKVDFPNRFENTYKYMGDFIDNSTGSLKNLAPIVDMIVEGIGSRAGEGVTIKGKNIALPTSRNTGQNLLSTFNGLASAFWLTTPRFMLAQVFQPLYNLPKGLQLKAQGVTEKSAVKAYLQSQLEAFTTMSEQSLEGLNWAKQNGFIDSKVTDLIGLKYDKPYQVAPRVLNLVSKNTLGKVEEMVVRTPSFLFYDMLLRDSIKNKQERWEVAGVLTDDYMVNYTKTDSPLMYSRLGMTGDSVKPLKQFQHAYYGQLIEHLGSIKADKTAKPLAAFLGVQLSVSGLKGFVGIAEATALILAINTMFNLTIPTPEELLATTSLPEGLVVGGASVLTGMDMSGTLGAPTAQNFLAFPGLGFGGKAAYEGTNLLKNKATGMATEADEMKALLSMTPNIAHGHIEEAYTKPGMGPPNPENRMMPNLNPRTHGITQPDNILQPSDTFARYLGGRSLKEAREMRGISALKRRDAARNEQKSKVLDVMVDKIVEKEKPSKELVKKWVDLGGDPKALDRAILKQMKGRAQNFAERYINSKGWTQAKKAQKLKEFGLLLDNTNDVEEMTGILKGIPNAK